jgi:hypothetical protein
VDRRFDPKRAVEIIAPRYGSGYRIGGRLVLTAAHLLEPKLGTSCTVRGHHHGRQRWQGIVVWLAPGWESSGLPQDDAALVDLPEEAGAYEPAVLGRLPEDSGGLKVQFHLYGWPRWARTERMGQKAKAGGRHIDGLIYLADTSGEGILVIEPARQPEVEPGTSGSPWEGVSGAAVVCEGLVVAVQRHHQNPSRPGSLEAVPLSRFTSDAKLQEALRSNGIALKWPTVTTQQALEAPAGRVNSAAVSALFHLRGVRNAPPGDSSEYRDEKHYLGEELRKLREAAGESPREFGEELRVALLVHDAVVIGGERYVDEYIAELERVVLSDS